jgi:hypothetical protein
MPMKTENQIYGSKKPFQLFIISIFLCEKKMRKSIEQEKRTISQII